MNEEITVVSHSTLFYWWPVWAAGYLMALITIIDPARMTTVPAGTEVVKANGSLTDAKGEARVVKDQEVLAPPKDSKAPLEQPHLWMTPKKYLGVVYSIILLLVIVITNVSLRGLWSVIAILVIVMLSVIFALLGIWEGILEALSFLDIRINLAGYLFISTGLLLVWLVVFFVFDRQIYMVFTPGNLRLQMAIGDGETTYDTTGMTIQKQRNDLFRHWILGLGSGDLLVTTTGAQSHHFDMPNVLALGRRVREIEELLRTKQVVAAQHEQ